MDESATPLLQWAILLICMGVLGYFAVRYMRTMQRRAEEYHAERERFLEEFPDTLSVQEVEIYKNLASHAARITWLKENHVEFIEKMPYSIVEFKTAKHLDIKLVRSDSQWSEPEMLQRYLEHCADISLVSYQEDLDTFASWIVENIQKGFDRDKEVARLWESLTHTERTQLKQARKAAERKKILTDACAPSTSTYQIDYVYPVLMMTYCSQTYGDGGDAVYFDSNFDGSCDSGGDSGGGDGGGGD